MVRTEKGKARQATDVDRHIGERIRQERRRLGLTQAELAAEVGVGFKQIRKYEHGHNRVSAGMLYRIAGVLGVSVQNLFEGLDVPPVEASVPDAEVETLVRTYHALRTPRRRRAFKNLVEAIAENRAMQAQWLKQP